MRVPLTFLSIYCNNYKIKELAAFFVIARNLMMGTPRKGYKNAIQNNSCFLFYNNNNNNILQGIVIKKNNQTEKNMSFIAVSHKFT